MASYTIIYVCVPLIGIGVALLLFYHCFKRKGWKMKKRTCPATVPPPNQDPNQQQVGMAPDGRNKPITEPGPPVNTGYNNQVYHQHAMQYPAPLGNGEYGQAMGHIATIEDPPSYEELPQQNGQNMSYHSPGSGYTGQPYHPGMPYPPHPQNVTYPLPGAEAPPPAPSWMNDPPPSYSEVQQDNRNCGN